MPADAPSRGFNALLDTGRRRGWLGAVVFVVLFAVTVAMIRALPNTYRSTATILVENQQVPEALVTPTVTSALETRLHTISQEILSRPRLENLIDRFGLYPGLRSKVPEELLIARMRKDIGLELRSGPAGGESAKTVAFAVTFRGDDPETVADITNALASFYIEENLRARERQAAGTSQFLQAQLEETKKTLDAQEERLSQYKRRHLGELPQQMTANLTSLEQLGNQLRINSDQQTRALWRRDALSTQLSEAQRATAARAAADAVPLTPTTADTNQRRPPPTAPVARLEQLRQQLTELRTRYSDKYPEVIRLKAEIVAVERETTKNEPEPTRATAERTEVRRPPMPVDPMIVQLQADLRDAKAEIDALKHEEARLRSAYSIYQARVENAPRREQEFEDLSRGHQTTQEHYQSLLKRYQEARLAEDMEQRQKGEQFRILDQAVAAQTPSAPNRPKLLVMSLVLCAGVAIATVILTERLDTSFHSADDLRAFTSVPVVASLPLILTRADMRARRRRTQLAFGATVLGLAALVTAGHFVARGNERLVWILSRGAF